MKPTKNQSKYAEMGDKITKVASSAIREAVRSSKSSEIKANRLAKPVKAKKA